MNLKINKIFLKVYIRDLIKYYTSNKVIKTSERILYRLEVKYF